MPDRRHREPHSPGEFAQILSGEDPPLLVGGQAVNIWAELYADRVGVLRDFAPFTSVDADIHGSRAMAEILARRAGWECHPVEERDSVAVAILSKTVNGGQAPLTIEVLQEVNGLTSADLHLNSVIELAAGERYRIPPPLVLLKAKLYNLVSLANLDRPQDLKHTQMLMHIVPQRFVELMAEFRAGRMPVENVVGSLVYARQVVQANASKNAARTHGLDFRQLVPPSLSDGPPEIRAAVRHFFEAGSD